MSQQPRITVVCGHYGCGKTNLTLNLALEAAAAGERVTVADLDIVNPYFRSSEYGGLLEEQGVRLIAPVFAGTTLDTPTLPPELYSIFEPQALGGLHSQLEETGYQMLYVINRYRVLSQTPEEAAALLQEIEAASRLKATALVNNSHLGVETRLDTLLGGLDFARKTAQLTGLPLLYSTAPDFALRDGETLPEGFKRIQRHVKFMWEV